MTKRNCQKGFDLLYRYNRSIGNCNNSSLSLAESARARMYQLRAKRDWFNHKSRCRICSGIKSE